ncbi:MAG: hypothetical protein K2K84_09775 [Muribaculaceae bacterium]|nr:hypothetical protein [Muribaculaceae bacterium]
MAKKRTTLKNVAKKATIIELMNLRPEKGDDGRQVFRAVAPATVIAGEGWEPVGEVDGQVIVSNETMMKIGSQVFETAGRVRGIIHGHDGSLTVDDGSGRPRRLERADDGQWVDFGQEPVWNQVTITAKRYSTVELTIPAMMFDELPATGAVTDTGVLNRLAGTLGGAYAVTAGVARQRGVLIRPVMARATVLDSDGAVLYRGPEVLVGTECLGQYDDTVNLSLSADGKTTAETRMELTAFRLHVKVDAMNCQGWVERAATLVIETGPQFHPWVAESGARRVMAASVGRGTGQATDRRLAVSVPGAAMSLSPSRPDRSAVLIETVAGRFDEVCRVAARFGRPYERGVDAEITIVPFDGLNEEVSEAAKALEGKKDRQVTDSRLRLMNAPNRFSARVYASDGTGTVVAGDPEVNRFRGFGAAELAASTAPDQSYKAMTTVIFDDGSSVSRLDVGNHDAPLALSPFVSYPSPDATGLRIGVEYPDGTVQRWVYSLHPDPSGRISVAVDQSIAPASGAIDEESEGLPESASEPLNVRLKSTLAVISTTRPTEVMAVGVAEGSIRAMAAARTSGGAWEFGRSRFIVGTDRGMLTAGVSATRDRLVLNHLNDRIVEGPMGLAGGGDGAVYAVERGRVLRIEGTRTEEIDAGAARSTDMDAIAVDMVAGRVIVGSTNGSTAFHHIDMTGQTPTFKTPALGPFNELKAIGTTVYAATQSGLYAFPRADSADTVTTTDVSITARVDTADRDRAIRRVDWPAVIDDFDGEMKVERFFMSPYPQALLSGWTFNGAVHTTLRFPVIALSVRTVYATISGTVGLGSGKRAVVGLPE